MEELMEITRKTIAMMGITNAKQKELKNKYNKDVEELKIRYGLSKTFLTIEDSDKSEHFCNTNQLLMTKNSNKSTQLHGSKEKRLNSIETHSSQGSINNSMAQLSDRPTRIAKVKAGTKLKEQNLNLKMRKPSIKVERISKRDAETETETETEELIENPAKSAGNNKSNDKQKENKPRNTAVNIKNEEISLNSEMNDSSLTWTTADTSSKYGKASIEKRKSNHVDEINHDDASAAAYLFDNNAKKLARDDSLIYISKNDAVIVELSDDDDDDDDDDRNKMPPPPDLPPPIPSITKSSTAKQSGRTKKKRNTKKNSIIINADDVFKQERKNSSTIENDSCSINPIGSTITTMPSSSSSSLSVPSTRSKTRKGRIEVKPIKEEIIMEEVEEEEEEKEEEPARDEIQGKLITETIESLPDSSLANGNLTFNIETVNTTILQESNTNAVNTPISSTLTTTKIPTPFLSTINKVNSTTTASSSSQSTKKLLLLSEQQQQQQKSLSNQNHSRLNATQSKLGHLNNQTQNASKSRRENSAEDIKRGIQAAADEKKRKREEKIRHVRQQREAREKEKMDKYRQQVEEKNEKLRQDAAKKREQKEQKERERKLLEEIHKNLKFQQQQNNNNNNDDDDDDDETTFTIQRSESRRQQELEDNHKKNTAELINSFDLLECDASTSDEDEKSNDSKARKERRKIPEWSKGEKREECLKLQQHIPSAITDSFFSVEPMTPDLREIFPTIRERFLRRNSSAIWNSPLPYP